jgi:hypothetical protein
MYKRKLRKLWRRFCITYWPWPPYLWRKHNQEATKLKELPKILSLRPRARTSQGWETYEKRFAKVFKAANLKQKIIDSIARFSNRYGWGKLKYWFKYRFQKKHRYNVLESGLKPGYYDFDEVLIATISGPRFQSTFEAVWEEYQASKKENPKLVKKNYHTAINNLKHAYDWFVFERPKLQRKIEDYLIEDIRGSDKIKDAESCNSHIKTKLINKHKLLMKKVIQLEKNIVTNDTKYAKLIIHYRTYLWH